MGITRYDDRARAAEWPRDSKRLRRSRDTDNGRPRDERWRHGHGACRGPSIRRPARRGLTGTGDAGSARLRNALRGIAVGHGTRAHRPGGRLAFERHVGGASQCDGRCDCPSLHRPARAECARRRLQRWRRGFRDGDRPAVDGECRTCRAGYSDPRARRARVARRARALRRRRHAHQLPARLDLQRYDHRPRECGRRRHRVVLCRGGRTRRHGDRDDRLARGHRDHSGAAARRSERDPRAGEWNPAPGPHAATRCHAA